MSNKKIIGNNEMPSGNINDEEKLEYNNIYNKNRCVIHLIYCDVHEIEDFNEDNNKDNICTFDDSDDIMCHSCYDHNDYNDNNDYNNHIKIINNYISDQCPELWSMMKRGDILENIYESNIGTDGRYIIDIEYSQKKYKKIIRNGLIVRGLNYEYDMNGNIPFHFYSITEFEIGYFNDCNLIVNNRFCPNHKSFLSKWKSNNTIILLDIGELKLDSLQCDDIVMDNVNSMNNECTNTDNDIYTIQFIYNNIEYVFAKIYNKKSQEIDCKNHFIEYISDGIVEASKIIYENNKKVVRIIIA